MNHRGQTFTNQRVELDGHEFVSCVFNSCELVYAGGQPPVLDGCSFDRPRFMFTLAARNTLAFMRGMYAEGFQTIIDRTIDAIREGAPVVAPDAIVLH